MEGGAFGGGKAGMAFDPISFVQRPQTIVRMLCWLFSIIVFGCISSKGWVVNASGKEVCLYDGKANACNYGVGIAVIAFLASSAFIIGDALFEQFSSIKTRKHYVYSDFGFSSFWMFLFFVGFCYLTHSWSNTTPESDYGVNNVQAAIAFSFFSIFSWAGCAWFAYQRYKLGSEGAFATGYEAEGVPGSASSEYGYPRGADPQDGYQEAPFNPAENRGPGPADFQTPTY